MRKIVPLLPLGDGKNRFRRHGLLGMTLGLGLLAAAPAAAQTVYGLSGTNLVTFQATAPGTITATTAITGIAVGQTVVGMDVRPNTGQLFALGYNAALTTGNAQLYTINVTTGAATPVGAAISLPLGSVLDLPRIGFDFNPTVDRIRVVSSNDANYRLNPNTGAIAATDLALNYAATDANAGTNPGVGAAAYTNSYIGTAATTLYDIDEAASRLVTQVPPNDGVLNTIGSLGVTTSALNQSADLDIYFNPSTRINQAYLVVATPNLTGTSTLTNFYGLNLGSGATTSQAPIGDGTIAVTDIAIAIDRTLPAVMGQLLYATQVFGTAATGINTNLLSFDSTNPSIIRSISSVTGIVAGQTLVGTDFRPNTGQLFGLGYDATTTGANSQLYTINLTTGVATSVGAAIRLELGGATDNIGFDFNPTVDRIRVVSTNRANIRLNPNNGALAATDGTLTYAAGDANAGATPRIGSAAYTNSFAGSTGTALYDLDEGLNVLALQNPPNNGTLNTQGASTGLTVNAANPQVDLDIYYNTATQTNQAFLAAIPTGSTNSSLFTVNLTAGTGAPVGTIGYGVPVRDISAALDAASIPNSTAAVAGRLLYGIAGGNLVSFDSSNPSVIRTAVNITGLPATPTNTQVIVGADFRPATGDLYALGYDATNQQAQLYTVNLTSGALTAVGGPNPLALGATATAIGFDFNPTVDLIRVVSATNQANFRVNPNSGAVTLDTPLNNPAGAPVLSAVAYTNNDNNTATSTQLFGYDQTRNVLQLSSNANGGVYGDVGSSGITVNPIGVDFDIFADLSTPATPVNSAFLVAAPTGTTTDNLYTVNLTAGTASLVGRIGNGSNLTGLAAFLTPTFAGLTWTGAVSTDWGTAANWSPAQVPTAADNVTIPNVANDPVVSDGQQANNVTLVSGATLTSAPGGVLTINGNFTNNGGTTLGSGTGSIVFNGAAAQTISGTTTFFNNLTTGAAGLTAGGPVQVQRVLALNGNLTSNGNLTLLSNATGTAHVVNINGTVVGNATVQRYIDGGANASAGYRHYSAPVSGSTVADLTTSGFSPVVNSAYNTAADPSSVTPFPTVFGYDESRVTTTGNPAPQDFDKGFFSPAALGDALETGRGYTVNIPASQTVDFLGTLNNGTVTRSNLTRGTQAESGWHLLGNPYPSPIDWDLVGRSSVDATVYVFRSSGPYAGTYSSYVANGTGTNGGTDQIATGQGFFVRSSTAGAAGTLTFTNAARLTTYANPTFQRTTTDPLVRLDLRNAGGNADEAVVYFAAGATTGFDSSFDAYKLTGSSPLLLASQTSAERLSINGMPALGTGDVLVPLVVDGAQAGSYTLRATELLNLPAGTYAYLRDQQTGTVTDLAAQASYSFTLTPGAATGRFSLQLTQQRILANAPAALSQQVALYPNPAREQVSLSLPAALAKQAVRVSVVNTLGQVVLTRELSATRGTDVQLLSLSGVAKGIYTVRLSTSAGVVNKRLVVE
ncbi:DUF4394 domain-containing protein [Hymenobacter sp.]|jgi:hypothetical protein|uniref:DUF4394 domain-containing protein n=1 Tax=Hymenobacter sp. TaxID=1898978 RepID=UPI002EDA0E44